MTKKYIPLGKQICLTVVWSCAKTLPPTDRVSRKLPDKLLSLKRSGYLSETICTNIKPTLKQSVKRVETKHLKRNRQLRKRNTRISTCF